MTEQKDELIQLLKHRRRFTRLKGHSKCSSERECQCGTELRHVNSGVKSGGWLCEEEEKEWDEIFDKLDCRDEDIDTEITVGINRIIHELGAGTKVPVSYVADRLKEIVRENRNARIRRNDSKDMQPVR